MKIQIILFIVIGALSLFTPLAHSKTLLYDGFSGNGAAATSRWETEYHVQGRGKFEGPGYRNGNGQLTLGVYSGNFSQQIIRSKRWFAPGNGKIVAEARVRIAHNSPGIVHGFFFYNQYYVGNRLKSDELDFEWLTTRMQGNRDPIQVTTWQAWDRWNPRYGIWNDPFHGTHATHEDSLGKQLNWKWRVYKMVWTKDKIDFYVDNSKIHTWRGAGVPSGRMRLFLNSWVADSGWPQAYSRDLKKGGRNWYSMEVDWVRVTD